MTVILGIDPGLNITGYGVIEKPVGGKLRLLEAGIVRSHSKVFAEKIREIYEGVQEIISSFSPEAMALEQLYSHYDRPQTAIMMGHARGAICLAAALANIPVHPYSATKIKKLLTGSGHAPKDQMQRAIQLELNLKREPSPPDVADALAAALCHCYHGKIH
jgi:crossover junction endodeoxyribonuclease RuvC